MEGAPPLAVAREGFTGHEMTTNAQHRTSQHHSSTSTMAELEASNSAKDEFLGLVSHELRTPVTTILGNARLLQDRRDQLAVEQRDSMLADIAAEAERLHEIIENLLSLTRLGTGIRPDSSRRRSTAWSSVPSSRFGAATPIIRSPSAAGRR